MNLRREFFAKALRQLDAAVHDIIAADEAADEANDDWRRRNFRAGFGRRYDSRNLRGGE